MERKDTPLSTNSKRSMQQSSTLVSWYALKAYYNKIELIMEVIESHGKETYVPMETVRQRGKDGKMIETERPLIPGVVFFRCDGSEVSVIRELLTDKAFIYHRQGRDKREPAPISDRELDNFRRFVDYSDHYERIDNQTINLSKGQPPFSHRRHRRLRCDADRLCPPGFSAKDGIVVLCWATISERQMQ